MNYNLELDVRGLRCPLPILRAKKAINQLESGQILHVIATDSATVGDFAAFAKQTGHHLLDAYQQDGEFHFILQKKEAAI